MRRVEQRLRLGNIVYSNCFPIHGRLLDKPEGCDPELIDGVPTALNALLEAGTIDVAPSSSIEYALHADRYRLMPDLVIGSRGPVRSILFVSDRPPEDLDGRTVALPTASATSVVLLKILLRLRWQVEPRFRWFDQASADPLVGPHPLDSAGTTGGPASAALFIGDVALRRDLHPELPVHLDLGEEWTKYTGLPFAFALWQCSSPEPAESLRRLHASLLASRAYSEQYRADLAVRYGPHFAMTPPALERYWSDLTYQLDGEMIAGLLSFYELAVRIGELPAVPELRWID